MIGCPVCGGPTDVLETRDAPSGTRRRRSCKSISCTGKITTMEVVIRSTDRYPGGMALVPIDRLRKMAAVLADVLQEQVGIEIE